MASRKAFLFVISSGILPKIRFNAIDLRLSSYSLLEAINEEKAINIF